MVAAQGDWRKPSYHIDKGAFDLQYNMLTRAAGGRALTHSEILAEGGDYYEYIWGIKSDRKCFAFDRGNSESEK